MLDCGHEPSPSEIGTGYAETPEGEKVCYPCAEARERVSFARSDKYFAYLSQDGKSVTTWTGGFLARTLYVHKAKLSGFGGYHDAVFVNVYAPDGSVWSGRGPGAGMYIRLKRTKRTLAPYREDDNA